MESLSQIHLLNLWERGRNQTPLRFCIDALSEAFPEISFDNALLLPIGIRDSLILKLRCSIFGDILYSTSVCPSCGEKVEWEMNLQSFGLPESRLTDYRNNFKLRQGNYFITFRLPNTADIMQLPTDCAVENSHEWLLSRCILDIKYKKKTLGCEDLSDYVLDILSDKMSEADKFADVIISLSCNKCSSQWEAMFDIISYFWIETNAWAMNTLNEVGILAYHFGWSENQILELSSSRRRIYLEMIKT